jgi:hypothetical protein
LAKLELFDGPKANPGTEGPAASQSRQAGAAVTGGPGGRIGDESWLARLDETAGGSRRERGECHGIRFVQLLVSSPRPAS